MKVELAIQQANEKLKKYNIRTSLLDSELLMSKVLNKKREFIILNSQYRIEEKDLKKFEKLVYQRLKGQPLAYLIGKKSFWKNEFEVNKNVLIPRPDTETIIEQVLKIYKNKIKLNFLEIGVGSGCIILSILKEKKGFRATGIDVSPHCIKTCKINAYNLGIKNRIKLYKSDIDNFNKDKYDLIISNPPYIKNLDLRYLDKDVRDFEPMLALDGGLDGTSEIRKVIKNASELIKKNGKLILEIAFNQKEKVKKLLIDKGFYINEVIKDLGKKDRCIISTKK